MWKSFETTVATTGGDSPFAGVVEAGRDVRARFLRHRSVAATTTFDEVSLAGRRNVRVTLVARVLETGYEADDSFEAYATIGEAASSALAYALFEIPGVANVFLTPQFVTVTKRPDVDWDELLPSVEQVLADFLNSNG